MQNSLILIREYKKTRDKIRKQLNQKSQEPEESGSKQKGNITDRVDTKLSDKLSAILKQIHEK